MLSALLINMYVQVIHSCLVVVGSSHRQSVEVSSCILTPAIPAMQLQCAQIIVPSARSDASPWLEWTRGCHSHTFCTNIYDHGQTRSR